MTALQIYEILYDVYGQPPWWSDDPYIVMVQSILVQNTSWSLVRKTTDPIQDKITPEHISGLATGELEDLIRPCGFCKGKAATIQRLTRWYAEYGYEPERMMSVKLAELRKELLSIKGIGAETADVILVYAFHKPSFVIDAYTRRFMKRLGFPFRTDEEIRAFFESELEKDYRLYGWLHWLILEHGIAHCRKVPVCSQCPFEKKCRFEAMEDSHNVKCDPLLAGSLRTQEGFYPSYHIKKEKWISIRLDGSVPEDEIKGLVDMSYELTGPKMGRKKNTD